MSNLDPLASLIDYVTAVKPYHTKIYEVLLRYVYNEPVNATVTERYRIDVTLYDPDSASTDVCAGWDTDPWNVGLYDSPSECATSTPMRVRTTVTDALVMYIDQYLFDQPFVYVEDHTQPIGWDTVRWDWTEWDKSSVEEWLRPVTDGQVDAIGTTISESLTIQVI